MQPEIQKLEAELAALQPAALDAGLADRLVRAVEGHAGELAPEQRATEGELGSLTPAAPRESTMAALMTVLEKLPFPESASKVVPFPNARGAAPERSRRMPWAAAAAVAIAGGLAALMVNPGGEDVAPNVAESTPVRTAPAVTADPATFQPASFESGVSNTRDMGRMWAGGEQAVRVVKVVYKDRVVWLNEQGEEVVTEMPRTEYLVVPEEID